MATNKQDLGKFGELAVVQNCPCPRCKRENVLQKLPPNFRCADVICDFCGYLAQVKAVTSVNLDIVPKRILGGAWGVQEERMNAGFFFPLFIVLVKNKREFAIYYLSADLQTKQMFLPRKKLSDKAKRAGWQGFIYNVDSVANRVIRIV
jgi:type II restriction enzyme